MTGASRKLSSASPSGFTQALPPRRNLSGSLATAVAVILPGAANIRSPPLMAGEQGRDGSRDARAGIVDHPGRHPGMGHEPEASLARRIGANACTGECLLHLRRIRPIRNRREYEIGLDLGRVEDEAA